jgi:hypothetical protein
VRFDTGLEPRLLEPSPLRIDGEEVRSSFQKLSPPPQFPARRIRGNPRKTTRKIKRRDGRNGTARIRKHRDEAGRFEHREIGRGDEASHLDLLASSSPGGLPKSRVVEGGGASWGGRGRRRGAAGLRVFIVGRQAASLAPPPSSVPSSQVSSLVVLGASSVSSNRCATVCSSDEPMTTGSDGLGFGDYPSCTPGFF